MRQVRRRCGVVIAGLLGLALLARTGATRAGSSPVGLHVCPLSGTPATDRAPLPVPAAPDAGRPASSDPAAEPLFPYLDRREAGDLPGNDMDESVPPSAAPLLPVPAGLTPALADIYAAETGTLPLDDEAAPPDDPPLPDVSPAPSISPMLPEPPPTPDPRALLA